MQFFLNLNLTHSNNFIYLFIDTGAFAEVYGRGISYERVLRLILNCRITVKEDGTMFATWSDFWCHSIELLKTTDYN